MILSNIEIQKAIDEKRLMIIPEPTPREAGENCPYDTASVDLRLGNKLSIPQRGPFTFDLSKGIKIAEFLSKNCQNIELGSGGYSLQPNTFVLAFTLESIELPIIENGCCLAGRIEGKSSFARCGLLVHFTAPTIHPDWKGPLTLEIINLGVNAIMLYPNMRICQLILEEVKGIPYPNPSQFHMQTSPCGRKQT